MKFSLTIAVLLFSFSLSAQRIFRVDSDVHFRAVIDSLRNDFKSRIEARDKKVLITLSSQIVYSLHDTVSVFFPSERAIAFYLTGNYKALLTDVLKRVDYHYTTRARDFKRPEFHFPTNNEYRVDIDLIAELVKDQEQVELMLHGANLKDDELEFLQLYLNSILAYRNLRDFDTEQMNKDCDMFLSTHPNSPYREYVEKVLNIRLKTMNLGIGAGVFTGFNFMGGNIGDYFRNYFSVGPTLELGYKKILVKAEIAPSFSRNPKQTFIYKNNFWSTDSTPFAVNGNLNLAYIVLENEKFRVIPYAGIGTHRIHLNDNADNMVFRPNLNCGLEIDWKFAADNKYGTYNEAFSSGKGNTNWHLRFRLGYSQFRNADPRFNGGMIYTKIEIGFYSNPARRIKSQ